MKRILFTLLGVAALVTVLSFATNDASAQSGSAWNVFYYNNPNWSGNPVFSNTAPYLDYNWNGASPAPNIPGTNWSLAATTSGYFTGGTYQFSALADDEVLLTVDNQIVIDTRGRNQVGKQQLVQYGIAGGVHNVQVNYRQFGGTSYLHVTWGIYKPINPPPPPPPSNLPFPVPPPSAGSVSTPFGNYTPCIQQNLHQSKCFVQNGEWNSPNIGSIEMEPQITVWGNCSPADSEIRWTVDANVRPIKTETFRCSKSLAGWFPG